MICSLAKELGENKITVNAVAPGIVVRPDDNSGENITHGTNFLHEKCLADDVANVVLFLCSEEGRFVTGQTYAIDGGRSLAMKGSD
jgi:3-oxoacyl-[acyl-carrier protein] reductase